MYGNIIFLSFIGFSFCQINNVLNPNAVGGAIKGGGLLSALNGQSLTDLFKDPCKSLKTAGQVQSSNSLGNAAEAGLRGNLQGALAGAGEAYKAQQQAKQNEQNCNQLLGALGLAPNTNSGNANVNSNTNVNSNSNVNSNAGNQQNSGRSNSNNGNGNGNGNGGLLAALKPNSNSASNTGAGTNAGTKLDTFNP